MEIVAAVVTLMVALAAALVPARHRNLLIGLAVGAFAVALSGVAFLLFGPKDLLSRYPTLTYVLHPYVIGLEIGLSVVIGTGVLLGLVARAVYHRVCRAAGNSSASFPD